MALNAVDSCVIKTVKPDIAGSCWQSVQLRDIYQHTKLRRNWRKNKSNERK